VTCHVTKNRGKAGVLTISYLSFASDFIIFKEHMLFLYLKCDGLPLKCGKNEYLKTRSVFILKISCSIIIFYVWRRIFGYDITFKHFGKKHSHWLINDGYTTLDAI
jgi:hypothetical protein